MYADTMDNFKGKRVYVPLDLSAPAKTVKPDPFRGMPLHVPVDLSIAPVQVNKVNLFNDPKRLDLFAGKPVFVPLDLSTPRGHTDTFQDDLDALL